MLKNITKKFEDFSALSDVSFSVMQGEVVGFVGANGAGKTTTISTILGFISPSAGEVQLFGRPVQAPYAHKTHAKIGYAAGDMTMPERLTGRQFLQFVAHQSARKDIADSLKILEKKFQPQLDKKIATLSRGNKQKIALIAAFMGEPELIILDEPTSGLDPVMQEVFLDLVRGARTRGATVFMSSHYLNEVADVCSRVILMRNGKIVKDVATSELLEQSGKTVRVVTGYGRTLPPKGVSDLLVEKDGDDTIISFVSRLEAKELQLWLASIKQLKDVEVTEYNLAGAFEQMYANQEDAV